MKIKPSKLDEKSKLNQELKVNQITNKLVLFLATGFGSGNIPFAPGTWGTVVAVPIYYFFLRHLSFSYYAIMLLLTFLLGVYLCDKARQLLKREDPSCVVWDEMVGYWFTMLAIPNASLFWCIVGFGLFRLFDITKPFPIGYLDRKIKGGLGIMLDDIAAGVYAAISLGILTHVSAYVMK